MMGNKEPDTGSWYYRFDTGKNFKVMEVDEVEDVAKIQYLGGDIDKISLEDWMRLELEKAE